MQLEKLMLHDTLQDLCVKVESTDSIVKLVTDIQQEEDVIVKAVRDKMLREVQQKASKNQVWLLHGMSALLCQTRHLMQHDALAADPKRFTQHYCLVVSLLVLLKLSIMHKSCKQQLCKFSCYSLILPISSCQPRSLRSPASQRLTLLHVPFAAHASRC